MKKSHQAAGGGCRVTSGGCQGKGIFQKLSRLLVLQTDHMVGEPIQLPHQLPGRFLFQKQKFLRTADIQLEPVKLSEIQRGSFTAVYFVRPGNQHLSAGEGISTLPGGKGQASFHQQGKLKSVPVIMPGKRRKRMAGRMPGQHPHARNMKLLPGENGSLRRNIIFIHTVERLYHAKVLEGNPLKLYWVHS
ncbi:MAG: hypothetical protein ACLRT5_07965 [Lachnospiraceae bacterium]